MAEEQSSTEAQQDKMKTEAYEKMLRLNDEIVEYQDGIWATRVTGSKGADFEFATNTHMHNPIDIYSERYGKKVKIKMKA